jgi:hypothetical protein
MFHALITQPHIISMVGLLILLVGIFSCPRSASH